MEISAVTWRNGKVGILDQTALPEELILLEIADHHGVVRAINNLSVRGAPAIGIAAAFGVVLSVWNANELDRTTFFEIANQAISDLKATRPTAKNLFWALETMRGCLSRNVNRPIAEIKSSMLQEAHRILEDDIRRCKAIGRLGAGLLPNRCAVLTHCNAGALATGGYGTALGIVRAAVEIGKKITVYADETRPLLQGARLTTFELLEDDIDVTLICDSAAAYLMKKGKIQYVIVGADRIARNGDVANKIGTFSLAVSARYHQIPFIVAAPLSTFDFDIDTGNEIPIEERDPEEVRTFGDRRIAPEDVPVFNPAFDVTPNELVNAIVCEKAILKPPFRAAIEKIKNNT